MSREIKFRAWDKSTRLMVGWTGIMRLMRGDKQLRPTPFLAEAPKFAIEALYVDGEPFSDSKFELMQYTGLKDKNGVEIYEGDVFDPDPGEFGRLVVAYKNRMDGRGEAVAQFAFEVYGNSQYIGEGGQECEGAFGKIQDLHLDEFNISEMEVIGNIHENPELLSDVA